MNLLFRTALLGLAALVALPAVIAQEEAPVYLELAQETPVVARGASGGWDRAYTDPGAVFVHDSQFHMFRNGFNTWPDTSDVAYHTSDDGLTWTQQSEDPIFSTDGLEFDGFGIVVASALVTDEQWVLYFSTIATGGIGTGVRRAVAANPLGDWELDETVILERGDDGSYDDMGILDPAVYAIESGYAMAYSAWSNAGELSIGFATSPDGITWTKLSEPLIATEAWEGAGIHYPSITTTGDGYVMIYRSPNRATRDSRATYGMATSTDGLIWTKHAEPIFDTDNIEGAISSYIGSTAYHDNQLYFYTDASTSSATYYSDIYAAVMDYPNNE